MKKPGAIFSFIAKVNVALVCGMLLLVLISAGSFITINSLLTQARGESALLETFVLLERVASRLKSAESRQRKYLITGDPTDLEAYLTERNAVQQVLNDLQTNLQVQSKAESQFALAGAIEVRIALLDSTLDERQTGGLEAARELIMSGISQRIGDEIDVLVNKLKADEQVLLTDYRKVTKESALAVESLIVAGGLLSIVLLSWAIYVINRYDKRRRSVESELLSSEAMSRAVTESMADGVITSRPDGTIVRVNTAAQKLFGYSDEALRGCHVSDLLPERTRAGFNAFFASLGARPPGFSEFDSDVLVRRSDGSEFPANVSFGDVNVGVDRLFTAIIRDETDRRRISEESRSSERLLRLLTNNVPALIAYVDANRCFQFHNRAYEDIFGLTFDDIRHRSMREVMGDDMYERIKSKADQVLAGNPVRYERSHMTASGEIRDFEVNYFPRYGESETEDEDKVIGFFSMGSDITEFKRVDRMKTEFVSTVSHELRTPLTSIRGSLGLISGGVAGELPEMAKNLVGIAKNNCERLIRLINDILDSEKIESGKIQLNLQVTDLGQVIEQAVASNEGFAGQHSVRLKSVPIRGYVPVNIDVDRIIQVITNLLSNAIKFSPPLGEVTIKLETTRRRVRVSVNDHGPGIPEEFKKRIFQKFSQADSSDTRKKGGTGLGLNISKAIIEMMSGTIGFRSVEAVGTTFYFELPLWSEDPQASRPSGLESEQLPVPSVGQALSANAPTSVIAGLSTLRQWLDLPLHDKLRSNLNQASEAAPPNSPRILHVEDDRDVQRIAEAISKDFATFELASTLEEARSSLSSGKIDLVLLDLTLGDSSGWDLFPEIMALNPPPAVVIFSASDVEPERHPLVAAVLLKAATTNEQLLATLQRVLAAPKRVVPSADA